MWLDVRQNVDNMYFLIHSKFNFLTKYNSLRVLKKLLSNS